jgi:outer membrane protein assembly factor BamB
MKVNFLFFAMLILFSIGCGNSVSREDDEGIQNGSGYKKSNRISMQKVDWIKSYSQDRMATIMTLGKDAIYSASSLHIGFDSPEFRLFKTSKDSEEIWSKDISLDIDSNRIVSLSFLSDIKLDLDGNILVTGKSQEVKKAGDSVDFISDTDKAFFMKLSNDGKKLWEYHFDKANIIESEGASISVDKENNYYLCGIETYEKFKSRVFVVKLSTSGEEIFVKRFPLDGDIISYVDTLIVENSLYIVGNEIDKQNISIVKTSLNGEVLWQKNFEEKGYKFSVKGLVKDHNNDIVITATKEIDVNDKSDDSVYILKINSNGDKFWSQEFDSNQQKVRSLDITPNYINVDTKNNIFIAGWVRGAFEGFENDNTRDPFLVKLSPDGNIIKKEQFQAKQGSSASAVLIDRDDVVYLGGFGKLKDQNRYSFLIKYD